MVRTVHGTNGLHVVRIVNGTNSLVIAYYSGTLVPAELTTTCIPMGMVNI